MKPAHGKVEKFGVFNFEKIFTNLFTQIAISALQTEGCVQNGVSGPDEGTILVRYRYIWGYDVCFYNETTMKVNILEYLFFPTAYVDKYR